MKVRVCIEAMLRSGLYDWVQAAEVVSIAMEEGGAETDREGRDLSLELFREVLQRGWMRIGELTHDGFREWSLPVPAAMERIQREWDSLREGMPNLGDICWLEITEEGKRLAEALYERDKAAGKSESGLCSG